MSGTKTTDGSAGKPEQPWWNPQRPSLMPASRYARARNRVPADTATRAWPTRTIDRAPLWSSVDLRDGNQALPTPMDTVRKAAMFDLLVELGFKEIEVGYPAASEPEFAFARELVHDGRIPDDVTIAVFTPARPELIDRTFEAIQGIDRAVVHLCLATACLWRDVVFGMSQSELRDFTLAAAHQVSRLADAMPGSRLRFQYSPETFNVTEPEFALAVCNEVTAAWDASPDRPVTLNLPSTVETDTPNVYADQIEWMHRNLDSRESIVLSVHPHNDRGTAVAAAELALMAGAYRVEGTLFGNGERTGNVCLATLALNLFSHGVDPQLDFSDIDAVRRTVESCNQMPVHDRHPYVGDLVYTAFSGTHQDAIAKGFAAKEAESRRLGVRSADLKWEVPYLPIDPHDVGRTYESVVRVNSQSGKAGVAHVLRQEYGLDLPRELRIEFARAVQRIAEQLGAELNSRELWDAFEQEYLQRPESFSIKDLAEDGIRAEVVIALSGRDAVLSGAGESPAAAFANAMANGEHEAVVKDLLQHLIDNGDGRHTVSYAKVVVDGAETWGVGIDAAAATADLMAVMSGADRALRSSEIAAA
jgi:2-isopropylmalate synthase